jgi:hypothetical protein
MSRTTAFARGFAAVGVLVLAGAASTSSEAGILFSEDFSNPAFIGGEIGVTNHFTDRFGPSRFFQAIPQNGWSFSGSAWIAVSNANGDAALYLNEGTFGGKASHTIGGLTPGQAYTVSFLTSGDNVPGEEWKLNVFADGTKILGVTGIDQASGTNPGQTNTVSFVASSTSETLLFDQASETGASPIIDNIFVSDDGAPPPPIPAVATLSTDTVKFGVVRAGTPNVTAKTTVKNTATGFPVDNLNVTSATDLPANVSVSGALPTSLGTMQSGDINFQLDTTNPGIVGGGATLGFTSTSTAESLVLPTQAISFTGTVTQLAQGVLVLDSGAGTLSGSGTAFTLDLGSLAVNTGAVTSDLGVLNDILGTAFSETLGGSFSSGTHQGYAFAGAAFSGLAGGSTDTGNIITFDTTALHDGVYTDKITFNGASSYSGLADKNLDPIVLTVTATITGAVAVPEPSAWAMMLVGVCGLGALTRTRRRGFLAA